MCSRQSPQLEELRQAAGRNGVTDLEILTGDEARALEPELNAARALLSPSTGIIDSHRYVRASLAGAWGVGYRLCKPRGWRLFFALSWPALCRLSELGLYC